jgi:hypothetical protein
LHIFFTAFKKLTLPDFHYFKAREIFNIRWRWCLIHIVSNDDLDAGILGDAKVIWVVEERWG